MTIAVTAVSGKLGSSIARNLFNLPGPETIIGLARTPENAKDLEIEIRPGDYDQPDQLVTSLQGVDTVLLVSGMDAPENRIQQHRNVIEAAKTAGVAKIVYTSILGLEEETSFSNVVKSNRQTEADIRASGLNWAIGRNGIYIEPDIDYIETYRKKGEIANSAGNGKCGYTTYSELAYAYGQLLTNATHDKKTLNLFGTPITQTELVGYFNQSFGTDLTYRNMSSEDFIADRTAELGTFFGPIIGGIYDGIRLGVFDVPSDFEAVAGRAHQSWTDIFQSFAP